MRTKLATYVMAGAVGLTGVAGAALVAPAMSYAATGDSTELTRGHGHGPGVHGPGGHRSGGHRPHLAVLEDLGITAEEVRAAVEAGSTLGELAEQQGVEQGALVDALVVAHSERLDAAVADGRLTQEEADEKAADLESRVTESLDDPLRAPGGRGHHGRD